MTQWYEISVDYILPIAVLIGLFPYFKLSLWKRRKVIFTTTGIGILIACNELIVSFFQYREYLSDVFSLLHPQATIAALYGGVFSLFLYFKISKIYHIYFGVVQVLFNTLYLLIVSYFAHWFFKYWHRNLVVEEVA